MTRFTLPARYLKVYILISSIKLPAKVLGGKLPLLVAIVCRLGLARRPWTAALSGAFATVIAAVSVACASSSSRDEASYQFGYQQISGSAQLLLNAIAETDAELGSNGTTTTKKDACQTATKDLPLISGANPKYVEKDVVAGCVDALSRTRAAAETSAASRPSLTSTSAAAASPTSSSEVRNSPPGHNPTIADYISQLGIAETSIVKSGELPSAPVVTLPSPPGWRDSGNTPSYAYGQIVSANPAFVSDPPTITAIYSRLTGGVDADTILRLAPNELLNLPGYQADKNRADTLAGYRAVALSGIYLKSGVQRIVGQKTAVIPGRDGVYVLQLNLEAAFDNAQAAVATEAFKVINDQTVITLKS